MSEVPLKGVELRVSTPQIGASRERRLSAGCVLFHLCVRLRVCWLDEFSFITFAGAGARGEPREQKMLKGHLPRVIYHRVHFRIRMLTLGVVGPFLQIGQKTLESEGFKAW